MSNEQYQQTLASLEKRARFYKHRAKIYQRLIVGPVIIALLLAIYLAMLIYLKLQPDSFTLVDIPAWLVAGLAALGPGTLVAITLLDITLVPILARRILKEHCHDEIPRT